jgi:hypothetical protein
VVSENDSKERGQGRTIYRYGPPGGAGRTFFTRRRLAYIIPAVAMVAVGLVLGLAPYSPLHGASTPVAPSTTAPAQATTTLVPAATAASPELYRAYLNASAALTSGVEHVVHKIDTGLSSGPPYDTASITEWDHEWSVNSSVWRERYLDGAAPTAGAKILHDDLRRVFGGMSKFEAIWQKYRLTGDQSLLASARTAAMVADDAIFGAENEGYGLAPLLDWGTWVWVTVN